MQLATDRGSDLKAAKYLLNYQLKVNLDDVGDEHDDHNV
jgi:hypothetical protein